MKKLFLLVFTGICFIGILVSGNAYSGLVASYLFNGNAYDNSGKGLNGVVYGSTLTYDRFGNANSAYHFDWEGEIRCISSSILRSGGTIR